jgi:uncharacterized membrane-anchored protein
MTVEHPDSRAVLSKVPQVTLAFWVIKILATTLGETGGDALSVTLELGYAISTLIFLVFFMLTLALQVASQGYHPFRSWAVLTRPLGATLGDTLAKSHAEGGDGVSRHHRYSLAGEPTGYPPGPGGSNAPR